MRPLTVRCAWLAVVGLLAVVLVGVTAFLVGEARAPEHMVVRELGAQGGLVERATGQIG